MSVNGEITVQMIPKDLLNLIPMFDGDQNILNLFIKKCEYILRNFNGPNNAVQTSYVFHCLTSRVCGRAAALLSEREDIATWEQLKAIFIQHFGDPRSEECVAIELENLKIKMGETYLQFCNRIQQTRSALCSKVNLLSDDNIKLAKITIYNNMCLNVFLYNLTEDLIRIVRLKNCSTLENALSIVMEEVNFQFQYNSKNKNKNSTKPQNSLSPNFGNNNEQFKGPSGFKTNFPNNFGSPVNQNFKSTFPYSMQNNFRSGVNGFRSNIPNQGYFRPSFQQPQGNFKFGLPNQQGFKFGIPHQQGFRPQYNNAPYRQNYNAPNPQFKFGIPPQNQPQRNPPHFQDSDVSMRTVRPVKQNMITHVTDSENNNLFYSYDDNESQNQDQECLYNNDNYESNYCTDYYNYDQSHFCSDDSETVPYEPDTQEETTNFPTVASKTNHQK